MDEEDFCIHGLYPKESCTICFKKYDVFIDYKFKAKSNYKCFLCKEPVTKDDLVTRLTNGFIVCADCTTQFKENQLKASRLVKDLQEQISSDGDLEVFCENDCEVVGLEINHDEGEDPVIIIVTA